MTYPVGVLRRSVNFGPAFGIEDGSAIEMRVSIRASRTLLWLATGAPALITGVGINSGEDGNNSYLLPVTDQEGWGDGNGNMIDVSNDHHTHTYLASLGYFKANKQIDRKTVGPFVLPQGDGEVDLDSLIPVTGSVLGIPVYLPDIGLINVGYGDLPPGTTVTVYFDPDIGWPDRPTISTNVTVLWADASGLGGVPPGKIAGIDFVLGGVTP